MRAEPQGQDPRKAEHEAAARAELTAKVRAVIDKGIEDQWDATSSEFGEYVIQDAERLDVDQLASAAVDVFVDYLRKPCDAEPGHLQSEPA
jgi:hypothetical protein